MIEAKIQAIITKLNGMLDDARKVDKGRLGEPGARLRKGTIDVEYDLKCIRGDVHAARAAAKSDKG